MQVSDGDGLPQSLRVAQLNVARDSKVLLRRFYRALRLQQRSRTHGSNIFAIRIVHLYTKS
jgi:hypothetical protein